MYLLDTDTVSGFLRGNPSITARVLSTPAELLWLSTITVEEGIAGARRFEQKNPITYSTILASIVRDYGRFQILPWSEKSWAIYRTMPERMKQHHRNDWKIGAMALAQDFIVVTCNVEDFRKIEPAVKIEDWSR